MGAAIAELLAYNGIETVLKDVNEALVQRGLERIRALVAEVVEFQSGRAAKEIERISELGVTLSEAQKAVILERLKPRISEETRAEILHRVRGVTDWQGVHDADLVIEAVFEKVDVKREVLAQIDSHTPDHTVIGSNTSSLPISRLARGLKHVKQTLVTHFFNPPGTLPLVEVAAGVDTREDVVSEVIEFLQSLRNHRYPLVPVRVKESPSYVVNRILLPVLNEACFALEEGLASTRDIDLAMKSGAGFPMGPFELADMIGLDVTLDVAETMAREFGDSKYRPSITLRRLVDAGYFGRKTGRGFYEYS
jgi:3-hydroxybutyryl-CoA dehydrogenase